MHNRKSSSSMRLTRRQMLLRTTAALAAVGLGGCAVTGAESRKRKVLFFSKSSGYEHSVIKRSGSELSHAEKILAELGPKHGIDFTYSKDGSLFARDYLGQFDAFFFYTTGDLTVAGTDRNPPMTAAGKEAFLDAIRHGKGFIGTHSASDTFHTNEPGGREDRAARYRNYGENADPFVRMLGGEFIIHDRQQKARQRVADSKFPGLQSAGAEFELMEEWYSLKDFSEDLRVLLVQETNGMTGESYQRPPFPATWARMHGRGRVFYTSMGHREDVWTNPLFQEILFGGIAWSVRNVDASATPNIREVTPGAWTIPPQRPSG